MDTTAKNGFTFTELLAVIGVIAIVGCVAVPPLMQALPNRNLRSTTRDIYSALMWAKSEAVRRNTTVTVAFSPADDEHIYKICVDKAGKGKCEGTCEESLKCGLPLPNGVIFNKRIKGGTGINAPPDTDKQSVSFTPRGVPKPWKRPDDKSSIGLCTTGLSGSATETCRKLEISVAGGVEVSTKSR